MTKLDLATLRTVSGGRGSSVTVINNNTNTATASSSTSKKS